MTKSIIVLLWLFFCGGNSTAQKIISSFSINIPIAQKELAIPVSINLDSITTLKAAVVSLQEITGKKSTAIACQVTTGNPRQLCWIIKPGTLLERNYRLLQLPAVSFKKIAAVTGDAAITIQSGNNNLLRYQFKTVYPPAGIDTNYKRSGFIHPLWTPHGQVLTTIQPKDHYHHYGIWNPWTHTVFEKDTVDFWNLKEHKGTVRFAKFITQTSGPVFSEFTALHEHVVFKKDGTEKIALNELQTVRVYNPQEEKEYYIVDITSQLSCATDSPLLIVAYRYGGFGWRATEEWTKDNCAIFTSEGMTRKNTDGSKARWIVAEGTLGNDYGGMVLMSYPGNYNYPEPLRIWDEEANKGRGDVFVNFAPTKDKDWLLTPGKTYVLKYRLLVFNGKMTKEKAEAAWQGFALPPAAAQ